MTVIRKRAPLDPALAQALASEGIDLAEADTTTTPPVVVPAPAAELTQAEKDAAAAKLVEEKAAADLAAAELAKTTAPAAVATGESALVEHLKAELKEARTATKTAEEGLATANATLVAAQTSLAESVKSVTALTAENNALALCVRESAKRCASGVGANASDIDTLSGTALAERYTVLSAELRKRYPGGQKTVSDSVDTAHPAPVVPKSAIGNAAVAATKLK